MGLFGITSTYDTDVERATSEGNTSDDWVAIMHVCDRLSADTSKDAARECMKAILKRMKNMAPHVALQALTLLDACEKNCGRGFRLEIASRMFEDEIRNLLSNSRVHVAVRDKLKGIVKQWAHEPGIIANAELKLIPDMYKSLIAQGYEFPKTTTVATAAIPGGVSAARTAAPSGPGVTSLASSSSDAEALRRREEDEFARAVALSILEAEQSGIPVDLNTTNIKKPTSSSMPYNNSSSANLKGTNSSTISSSLYSNLLRDSSPTTLLSNGGAPSKSQTKTSHQVKFDSIPDNSENIGPYNRQQHSEYKQQPEPIVDYSQVAEPKRYRVLYDFEAVEGDELTLKAGEIVLVNDDNDPSWWKGSNPRGEGLFPANFVTDQLDVDIDALNAGDFSKKLSLNSTDDDDDEDEAGGGKTTPTGRKKQTNTIFSEPLKIDEAVLDRALELIHNADLTGERPDDASLGAFESRSYDMTPLIDAELEQVDRQHLKLTQLGQRLFEAIKLYHETMATQAASLPPAAAMQQPLSYQQQHYNGMQTVQTLHHHQPIVSPAVYQHQNSYPLSSMATAGSAGITSAYWPHSAASSNQQPQQHPEYALMTMPPIPTTNIPPLLGTDTSTINQVAHPQQQPWMMSPQQQPAGYGNDSQWQQQPGATSVYPGGGYAYSAAPQ